MCNEIEKENFNPKFLKIKDYKTVEEYKNDLGNFNKEKS